MNQFSVQKNRGRQNQLETPVNVNEKETRSGGEKAQPQFPKEKRKKKKKEGVAEFKWPGIWVSAEYVREFRKRKRFGRRRGQNSEGELFYIGRPGGQRLQYGVSGGYTRDGKTNRKREFTGPRFTISTITIQGATEPHFCCKFPVYWIPACRFPVQ